MATFEKTLAKTYEGEGGWTIDQGGQTYQGISRKGHPEWPGWIVIDRWKKANGNIKKNGFIPGVTGKQLEVMVKAFYTNSYWGAVQGDKIKHQDVANFIFDFAVNSGGGIATINAVLSSSGRNKITDAAVDKLNSNPAKYYPLIYDARRRYYIELSKKNQQNRASLKGWLNRLDKYPKAVQQPAPAFNFFNLFNV